MEEQFAPKKLVIYWLYLGITMVLAMVVIGGVTRLTHSGLSMTHWSFSGSLPPTSQEAWVAEFAKYQQSPEYKEVHAHFEVEEFKSIYWWEYIHRMFGRLIGLVFIFPFIFFLAKKWIPRSMYKNFFIILGLGAFQAFLGWFMVKSGLVDVPRVSHFRLAAHLSTAFIACSYIYWVALRYKNLQEEKTLVSPFRKTVLLMTGLLFLQIVYGAFVAGLRAGWMHNTWPLMDGDIIAPAATALEPFLQNFINGRSGVQFIHRTLGLIVVAYSTWIFYRSSQWSGNLQKSARLATLTVYTQFGLGVATLLMEVPIYMGVIHQVFALIVLLSHVKFIHSASYRFAAS